MNTIADAQEKTAVEVQLAAADQTPEKGNLMNTIVTDARDISAADAAELLAQIDACPAGSYIKLMPGDTLHEDIGDVVVMPVARIRDPENLEGEAHSFLDFYRNDGHWMPLAERPDDWWESFTDEERAAAWVAAQHPNGVSRLGVDYFVVGRGTGYLAVGPTTLDGEPAIEFHHWRKVDADRRRAKLERYLVGNPVIGEHRPLWASRIDVYPHQERDGVLEVTYWAETGIPDVYLTQEAELVEGGPFRFLGKPTLETSAGSFEVGSEGFTEAVGKLRAFVDALEAAR